MGLNAELLKGLPNPEAYKGKSQVQILDALFKEAERRNVPLSDLVSEKVVRTLSKAAPEYKERITFLDQNAKSVAKNEDRKVQAEAQAKKDERARSFSEAATEALAGQSPKYGPPEKLTWEQVDDKLVTDLMDRGFPGKVALEVAQTPALWDKVAQGESFMDVADDLQQAGLELPSWTEAQAEARKREQWKADQAAKAEAKEAAARTGQPDWLEETFGRWQDDTQANREGQLKEAEQRGKALVGLGENYARDVTGSEGYKGLGEYRDEMRGIYDQGGLTDVTRANLEKARRDEDQWIRAQRESMLQDLAERGTVGGGAEIAGAIGDRAAAADRMSARDLDTNAFAQEQALSALSAASEADKTRFGWDRDIATTQMGLGKDATDERYSLAQKLADAGMQTYNTLFGDVIKRSGDAWDQAQRDVVPAAQDVADRTSGAATEGRENVAGAVTGGVGGNNAYGGTLAGGTGAYQPGSGVTDPFPAPTDQTPGQVEGAVGAAGAGADTALGVYEAFAGAGGGKDKDEEEANG